MHRHTPAGRPVRALTLRRLRRAAASGCVLVAGVTACDRPVDPLSPTPAPAAAAVKFWDANAAANWTDLATSLAARRAVNVARLYAYLGLAQLRAAEDAGTIRPHPPTSAAQVPHRRSAAHGVSRKAVPMWTSG